MDEKLRLRITKLIEKAERKLQAAQMLYESKMYEDSISRGYYTVYHAGMALLASKEFSAKTHSGLQTMISLHFVKTGILPREYYEILSRDKDLREDGDYEPFYTGSAEEAESVLEDARKFITKIKKLLRSALAG